MASILAFTGRLLFALLFVASGVQKLTTYDHAKDGGPVAQLVATKMEVFNKSVHDLTGVTLPFEQDHYKYLLLVAVATELLGALLFILDSAAGAVLLILFTVGVTPVIHDFWNAKEGPLQQMEGAQFFKNVALVGALLFYLGRPRKLKLA